MIEDFVQILQRIACLWLALSVIWPVVNNKVMSAAWSNEPYKSHPIQKPATPPASLIPQALATLILTIMVILISIF